MKKLVIISGSGRGLGSSIAKSFVKKRILRSNQLLQERRESKRLGG